MSHRVIRYLLLSVIILCLMAGCNFQSVKEVNHTDSPATVAAQTLEAISTNVVYRSEQLEDRTVIPPMFPSEKQPSPSISSENCINRALFIDDITIRDNMQIEAGSNFTKMWRLRNDGTCIWDRTYSLTFIGGERMDAPITTFLMETIQPGQTLDLAIEMTAPVLPGIYQSFWRLKSNNGEHFGLGSEGDQSFWVKIIVIPPSDTIPTSEISPTPTLTQVPLPLASPTPTATFQPTPVVYHQGEIQLIPGQDINLDNGETSSTEGKDLTLLELSSSKYSLAPNHPALLGVYSGKKSPTHIQDCQDTTLTNDPIPLDSLALNEFLCYITNEGRPGYLVIKALNSSIDFTYITWMP